MVVLKMITLIKKTLAFRQAGITPIKNKRGVILITTIIILLFLSVLGMSLLAFLFSSLSYSQAQLDRLRAMYLAESGLARAIYELRYDIDLDGNGVGNIKETDLGGGLLSARHNFQTSTLTAIGEFNHSKRVFQIKYSAI